jgi:L-fucose mutarotase
MLKGVPNSLSGELLKYMTEMGHGDEICIADANFPSASHAPRVVFAPSADGPHMLRAVLTLLPVDQFAPTPAVLMSGPNDGSERPPIWKEYYEVLAEFGVATEKILHETNASFYEHVRRTYVTVSTGDARLYGNIIVRKGIVA